MTPPVAIGSTIAGKYRVESVLGQGGMGIVVLAMHDDLDQRVAIKFLLKEALNDAEWIARFSRESKAAARIKSEHAVKVYDVGKLETGEPYMVMEYLEGRDLQAVLNEAKKLSVHDAIDYVLQACEAIAEAHSAGIVHRDLKPANLFVASRADGSSCVKILDFGISKVSSLTGGNQQTVTNTAAIVGSPLYMSPEQMRASKNVDRRTDIWSLGVILQELVSGEPSFIANTTAELCAIVLTAPPSKLEIASESARVNEGLGAVIAKCLAKNPEERYANIAELASALEPYGPPSVKTSVERVVRLAKSGARSQSVSIPEASTAPPSVEIKPNAFGQTELITHPPEHAGPPVPVAPSASTAAAWGSSQPSTHRSRTPIIVAGSALAAIAVLVVVFIATRNSSTPATLDRVQQPTTSASVVAVPVSVAAAVSASAGVSVSVSLPVATTAPTAMSSAAIAHLKTIANVATTSSTKKPTPPPVDTTGFGGRN